MDDRRPPDDTEPTRTTPPGDETQVMPPASEGTTQVLPGDDAGVTRVMPAGDQAPPPPPSQPTLVMTRGRGPERQGVPWWVWVIVALAIVAGAAFWYSFLRPTAEPVDVGQEFVGTWAPESGVGGGLVIAETADGRFTVTQYDAQLQRVDSTTTDLVDDRLEVGIRASAFGLTGVTGSAQGTLTSEGGDRLRLTFATGAAEVEPMYFVRAEVLLPAPPSPTPTPSPTPSPSLPPTPSPAPSGSPTADQQTVANIAKLQVGIVAFAAEHDNLYPSPQDVIQGAGLAQFVDPWPTNPFTGAPMAPGTSPGSYVYEQLNGGQAYRLTGYLGNGLTYVVP